MDILSSHVCCCWPDYNDVNDAKCQEGHSNDERSVGEPGAVAQTTHAHLLYWKGEASGEEANEDGVPGNQNDQDPGQVSNVEHLFLL